MRLICFAVDARGLRPGEYRLGRGNASLCDGPVIAAVGVRKL